MRENNESYWVDRAYYNGKYYVYFGVVPVLLLLLPFYVLTGKHLAITIAISIWGVAYIIGCFLLLWQIYRKYFPEASFLSYLLWGVMLVVGCGMFWAFRTGSFYGYPILAGGVLTVWALYLWILEADKERHSWRNLFMGALLLSLAAGCRPQFVLAGGAVLILFKNELMQMLKLERKGVCFALSMAVPVAAVAAGIMYYNYARFGSLFDFGATYNLTSNDMTHRGWHFDRIPSGIYYYLLEPTKITTSFPYIFDSTSIAANLTSYYGRVIFETPYGGLLFNRPILGLSMLFMRIRKLAVEKSRKIFYLAIFLTFCGLTILIMDIQMAGIVSRYHMDYGIFLGISSAVVMGFYQKAENNYVADKALHFCLIVCVLWSFIYEFLLWFHEDLIFDKLPDVYFWLRSMIEFWR